MRIQATVVAFLVMACGSTPTEPVSVVPTPDDAASKSPAPRVLPKVDLTPTPAPPCEGHSKAECIEDPGCVLAVGAGADDAVFCREVENDCELWFAYEGDCDTEEGCVRDEGPPATCHPDLSSGIYDTDAPFCDAYETEEECVGE